MWQPILEGEVAERAWGAVHGIADHVRALAAPAPELALFWTYLSSAIDDEQTQRSAAQASDHFARSLASGPPGVGLFGGVLGATWIAAHIADEVDDLVALVDAAVLEALSIASWQGPYDLMSGLVGYAVYFADRDDAAANAALARIVDHLVELGEPTPAGTTWHTRPELLPEHQRRTFPTGYYNCGMAHGVAGIVAVLAKIAARPDAPPATRALHHEAKRWLLAQRLGAAGFPDMFANDSPSPSRTAWCYGDPGVTLALWRGDSAHDDLDEITQRWMQRSPDEAKVVDAGLCHGAAGLAHICNRLYHATGRIAYRDAARSWFAHTLALRVPDAGIAGFRAYNPRSASWSAEPSLLEGAVGIGLALLAALTPIEPEWDRLMLCDLPVR